MTNSPPRSGKFLVIDGPNGVGKTTIARLVGQRLEAMGRPVLVTKEPTSRFNRGNEERYGTALARLIIEDRREHLAQDIVPALKSGVMVVCDRYVLSSLVYRKLDGLDFEATWRDNVDFLAPEVTILLVASPTVLRHRLAARGNLSRFERNHTPSRELVLYRQAAEFLARHHPNICIVQNSSRSMAEVAAEICDKFVLPGLRAATC